MKKIPTLFRREFDGNHGVSAIYPELTDPKLQVVLDGKCIPTVKFDGSCCGFFDGIFYKRYDAKKKKDGTYKTPPEGAIPCCDPDPVTGHWPHWVPVDKNNPADKWFLKAMDYSMEIGFYIEKNATYEAIGPHFNGNPHGLNGDILYRHGSTVINLEFTFDTIKKYLEDHVIEGIVFWYKGEPLCKIKRSDFGLPWNQNGGAK